jgi:uncharacterized membrane protein
MDVRSGKSAMTNPGVVADERLDRPVVRTIAVADLCEALSFGFADFWEAPSHMVFLSLIYPAVGVLLGRLLIGADVAPMLLPLAAGFALIGPFAAVGLYELSRRREHGLPVNWKNAFDVWHSPSRDALLSLGVLMTLLLIAWMAVARGLFVFFIGDVETESVADFLDILIASPDGLTLLVVGSFAGLLFSVFALAIGVVSIPLLLDRPVGVAVAVHTSIRAVMANPAIMALWGLIVTAALTIGALPVFVGLSVVMPVLAHATWHLYRRVVVA